MAARTPPAAIRSTPFPQERLQATYGAGARLLAGLPDWEPEPLAAATILSGTHLSFTSIQTLQIQ